MKTKTKCKVCNLVKVVDNFLREIEGEIKNVEFGEVKDEIEKLTSKLSIVLSKWVPQILCCLYKNVLSFNELKRKLNISSRVLSDKLEVLEGEGLIVRDVKFKPLRVYYRLMDFGRDVAISLILLMLLLNRSRHL